MRIVFSRFSMVFFLLLLFVLLPACAAPVTQVTATIEATAFPTKEPTPTITPRPTLNVTPEATIVSYLDIDKEDLLGVTVTFWHPFTGDTAERLREMTQNFNEENDLGIRVEIFSRGTAGALNERIMEVSAEKDMMPDLVAGPVLLTHIWDHEDWVIPVEAYLNHSEWGFDEESLAQFDAFALEQTQNDGVQTAMPLVRSASVLYYNMSWAQELGYGSVPTSLRAFREQACAAQQSLLEDDDKENDGTGGWIINLDESVILSWLAAYGEKDFDTADGDVIFQTAATDRAFNMLWQMNAENCAWTSRDPLPFEYFATRRALIYSGSVRDTYWQERAMAQSGSQDEWTLLPYPSESGAPILIWDASAAVIIESSPEEQLASWLFLQSLLSDKNQALLSISTNSLPVREDAWRWMEVTLRNHPEWAEVRGMTAEAVSVPLHSDWLITGCLLEDAAWQLFQPFTTEEEIPLILQTLDDMILELTEK